MDFEAMIAETAAASEAELAAPPDGRAPPRGNTASILASAEQAAVRVRPGGRC